MKNVQLKLVPYKFLMYMSSNMSTYFNLQCYKKVNVFYCSFSVLKTSGDR